MQSNSMDPSRTTSRWIKTLILFIILTQSGYSIKVQNGFNVLHYPFININASSILNNSSTGKITIYRAANVLSKKIQEAVVEELGFSALSDMIASLHMSARSSTDEDSLLTICERMGVKLEAASRLLLEMRERVSQSPGARSFTHPCPLNSIKKQHRLKDVPINAEKVVLNVPLDQMDSLRHSGLQIRRQYFLSTLDAATDRLCGLTPVRSPLRRLFHSILQPAPKTLMLLIDNGRDITDGELHLAVSVAREMVNVLQKDDHIGIILTAGDTEPATIDNTCSKEQMLMAPVTERNKELVFRFLNSARVTNQSSNIASALKKTLEILPQTYQTSMVIYFGTELATKKQLVEILKTISQVPKPLSKVIVTSCDVKMGSYSPNAENKNLINVFTKCSKEDDPHLCSGAGIHFNSSYTAGQVASFLLLNLPRGADNQLVRATEPVWEPAQRDVLVSLIMPCQLKGVVAVELYLSDLAEDVIYFNSFTGNRRAFIMDLRGKVVIHSSYSRPEIIVSQLKTIDVSLLEPYFGFDEVKLNMLSNVSGTMNITEDGRVITYSWKQVKSIYVVCLVSEGSASRQWRVASGVARELQHHRMDLLPPAGGSLCRHFKQVSSIHHGTLYLSPSSFQSPFLYLQDIKNGKDVSFTLMQSYMAYLKDATRLLSNPGLKPEIRNDVGILYPTLSYFKRQHIHGPYNKYIVRRYSATEHGVLVMFPGSILEADFEPNRKAWFTRAMESSGKVVVTPPYLDSGGAGYVVTVSRALWDPIDQTKPAVVVAMDMTMGFLYKMLLEAVPACSKPNIKCFLMEDRGYLLAHPSLLEPSGSGPIEHQHITHKESLIASDMLNHQGFVQKKLCNNFADGTVQRFYEFNTSLDTVLSNMVPREHCVRYYITAVPGTNAFVAMVNSSCKLGAFCPCSVVDRLCLNCIRMEQSECECPCECLIPEETCGAPDTQIAAPICNLQPEKNNHKNHFFYSLATPLKSCFDFQCDSYRTQSSCSGVLGCEWCQLEADEKTPLTAPFCSMQTACFNGVLGALTPYGEGSLGHVTQDDLLATYSAVGPIAGCIVALCLILAIAVYCYKQNITPSSDSDIYAGNPPENWQDAGVQLNHLPSEDEIRDDRAGHQDKLLLANDAAPPISPYRILTGYRRPNTAGESDHGYSTMTPHDDSEHLAFALVEPFIAAEGVASSRDAAGSPAVSSPRGSLPDLPMTTLPCGKNSIIAPVTVHRHMEAT